MSKLAHSNKPPMDEIEAKRLMEEEANLFAMELLMPTKFLEAEIAKIGQFDIEDHRPMAMLAKKFGVSQQIMIWRLAYYLSNKRPSHTEAAGQRGK